MSDVTRTIIQQPAVAKTTLVVGQGPAGPQGIQGPAGTGGGGSGGGDLSYTHNQGTAASVWTITHSLGKFPNVQVFDSAGDEVEGDVDHLSNTQVRVTFSSAFSGIAYLN